MKSILKKDSIELSITFEDYFNERIRIMQNSTDKYFLFLKRLDDLIARIDSTMENTKILPKMKKVRFNKHNKIFLIPPRKLTLQQTLLSIDFQTCNPNKLFSDLFY